MKKLILPKTVEYRGRNATIHLQNPRNTTRSEVHWNAHLKHSESYRKSRWKLK